MNRREFVAAAGMLLGATSMSGAPAAENDTAAVKRLISDYYETFFRKLDKEKYLLLLTNDYLLLENGEIFDAARDIASMPSPQSGYTRTDVFDFRQIKIYGDIAYAIYFLDSDMTDNKTGPRKRKWLESAILRRGGNEWRVALLHSTRIHSPDERT